MGRANSLSIQFLKINRLLHYAKPEGSLQTDIRTTGNLGYSSAKCQKLLFWPFEMQHRHYTRPGDVFLHEALYNSIVQPETENENKDRRLLLYCSLSISCKPGNQTYKEPVSICVSQSCWVPVVQPVSGVGSEPEAWQSQTSVTFSIKPQLSFSQLFP